jgi:hypothetical protein
MARRKFLFSGAVLAGIAMTGLAPPARADFEVMLNYGGATITLDGTTQTVSASGGASTSGAIITYKAGQIKVWNLTISPNGSSGGFTIDATIAQSNSPGVNNVATIGLSSLDITNQTGVNGNSTLTITTGDTGFTQPTGSNTVGVTSTISATAAGTNSADATVIFHSYVDTTNKQFGTQAGTPGITFTVTPGNSNHDNSFAFLSGQPIPYSITQVAQITLANGDALTDGSSGTTVTAPAPASMMLALSALPILGGVYLRRAVRRRPVGNGTFPAGVEGSASSGKSPP